MTQIDLAYGEGCKSFDFDGGRFECLSQPSSDASPLSDVDIGGAFDTPIASQPLDEIVKPGESVLIVVSDATRATASGQIVNLLVRRIVSTGVLPQDIAIIFATGIHRPVTAAESTDLLSPFITQRVRTINHDANDSSQLVSLGVTERGTSVEVNKALKDFDRVILTGGIAFHYFAGFTGGRKSICPGLASANTIRETHMLALDFENGGRRRGVGTGLLTGNAVHEECDRIAQLIGPAFSINTIVDARGRAVRIFAGDWREAHRAGCEKYLADHSIGIKAKRPVVVASCGGSPYDINLIQAHKSLDMASHACEDGGTIVWLAQCRDGLGRPDFLKWFDGKDSRSLESRLRESYEVNGQTAWSSMTKAERFRVILISDLPDDQVRQMGMTPGHSIKDALREVKFESGYILPRGASYLPVKI